MGCCGLDVGSYNLVSCRRGEGGEIKTRKEVNAFLEISKDNPFTYNMLKKAEVSVIDREKVVYAIGEASVNLAYTFGKDLRRPMKDGCLNPQESDAFSILMKMIHGLIGEASQDKEVVCYSVPANAFNKKTNVEYHQKVLEDILKRYKVNNKTVQPYPINEALALIFAELADKQYTGIGLSLGSGMLNFCYAKWSQPVFSVSSVDSGDWIDQTVGEACGENPSVINVEKTKVDLLKSATNMIERAVQTQYRILIEKSINNIKSAIIKSQSKIRTDLPVDIVVAGGTASPPGFLEIFKETLKNSDFPIPIANVIKPKDHLYTVSRGCLIAAENIAQ